MLTDHPASPGNIGAGGFAGPFLCRLTTTAAAAQHTVHNTAAAIMAVSSTCIARGTYTAGLWFRFAAGPFVAFMSRLLVCNQ